MENSFEVLLEQKQMISQAQMQSLEILQMDNTELNQMLYDEYLENPILDYSGRECGPVHTQTMEEQQEPFSQTYPDRDSFGEGEEEKTRRELRAPDKDSIRTYILWQLDRKSYTDGEWAAIEYMTDCLEDSGYYTGSCEEAALACGIETGAARKCLEDLRQLEPYGIFSAGLKECLLRQLQVQGLAGTDVWKIVDGYLEEAAAGKISQISRSLKITTAQVRKCISQIAHLTPRPLAGFGTEKTSYVVPDIIFRKEHGRWYGELNDSWVEDYHINDYYLKMMRESTDEELTIYFKKKLERVRFLMAGIQQRRKTILKIANLIIEKQQPFLEKSGPLKPLTMSEAADILGIHPSTVSRAVKSKYVQYPGGSIFMKNFFTVSSGSSDVSSMEIRQRIKEIIEGEDKAKPVSDKKIAELLEKDGIHVSRRLVAKCREEMMIKGSFERKISQ